MINRVKQAGFTLLELLITVVIILTLSIIGLVLANHFAFKYNQVPKVKESLTAIHDALNTCYFTQSSSTDLHQCDSIKNLEEFGFLNPDDIYNVHMGYSPNTYQGEFLSYDIDIIDDTNPAQLIIIVNSPAKVHLQDLNPTVSKLKTDTFKGHTYQFYHYEWHYPALLSRYNNRQSTSLLPKLEPNS